MSEVLSPSAVLKAPSLSKMLKTVSPSTMLRTMSLSHGPSTGPKSEEGRSVEDTTAGGKENGDWRALRAEQVKVDQLIR